MFSMNIPTRTFFLFQVTLKLNFIIQQKEHFLGPTEQVIAFQPDFYPVSCKFLLLCER